MSTSLPEFFIVGAPKCGTTALQDYLSQWPEVFMPSGKEFHHFADDLLRADDTLRDRTRYLGLFRAAGSGQRIGEASAFHLLSTVAAQRIHAARPDAKIIVMLRNPLEVVPALHAQLVFNGEEPLTDLAAALDAGPERKAGRGIPTRARFGAKLCYLEVVRFATQLERFLGVFPDLHVVVYDDFKRDTARAVREVASRLGIDPTFEPDLRVVNASRRVRSRRVQDLLLEPPAPLLRFGAMVMPRVVRRAARGFLHRLNTEERRREPLNAVLRDRIADSCADEVRRLGDLLGRDLGHWLERDRVAPQGSTHS